MGTAESCPRCGTARIGYFRYCLACKLDYEAAAAALATPNWGRAAPSDPEAAFSARRALTAPEPALSGPRDTAASPAVGVADRAWRRALAPERVTPERGGSPDPRTLRSAAVPSVDAASEPPRRTLLWTRRRVVLAVVALCIVAAALNVPLGGSEPAPALVPPVGSISFGSSFTPATFDLHDVSRALPAGRPVALVASLPDSVALGGVRLLVSSAATAILDQPVIGGVFPSPWALVDAGPRLFATTVVFPSPGTYHCTLLDGRGAILASGSFLAI